MKNISCHSVAIQWTNLSAKTPCWENIQHFEDTTQGVGKFVFESLQRDAIVESVLYRYPDFRTRTVICCSVMSGCPVWCTFCGTGQYFVRNLTAAEIIEQPKFLLEHAIDCEPSDIKKLQIMVMSMGEPLLNKNLIPAFHGLHRLYPNATLLISTSAPAIDYEWVMRLSEEIPMVWLQFSIHESTDIARERLIPFKNKLNLQEIADKWKEWYNRTGRKPFFNYCAHTGNTGECDVKRIAKLFDPCIWEATVSVICEKNEWIPTSNEPQRRLAADFSSKLISQWYNVRIFDPAGTDTIGGGCGQLWYVQDWMKRNVERIHESSGYKNRKERS